MSPIRPPTASSVPFLGFPHSNFLQILSWKDYFVSLCVYRSEFALNLPYVSDGSGECQFNQHCRHEAPVLLPMKNKKMKIRF